MSEAPSQRGMLPASVSPEAAAILRMIGAALDAMPPRLPPASLEEFDAANVRAGLFAEQIMARPIAELQPVTEAWDANGTPVLTVTPRNPRAGATPLVYVHGGGFVGGSARANLLTAAWMAETTGRAVHSIDYTLAPRGRWQTILGQVEAAWEAILAKTGTVPGMLGDSAGGCIAAAATLLLRERGRPLPAALVLLSPVVDFAGGGDTNTTLVAVDYLERRMLEAGLRAYADEADWANPHVSPLHGDFTAGFPPVLLQVGTREVLLERFGAAASGTACGRPEVAARSV